MVAGVESPLIVIVGETGSGKTALALSLAERFNGEVIAADSRTVYRAMDIGTAKPSAAERRRVRHHGLDIVTPDQKFTAYDFKQFALATIANINERGRLPFLVGGTGLYVDSVLYDFSFRPQPDPTLRAALTGMSVEDLKVRVLAAGMPLPVNSKNPRHLIRLLEAGPTVNQERKLRPNTLVIGLEPPLDVLHQRLNERAGAMISHGLISEFQKLQKKYGDVEALHAPAYRAVLACKNKTPSDLCEEIVRNDSRLAKRQRTWFRRNPCIHWLHNGDVFTESVELITTFLNK